MNQPLKKNISINKIVFPRSIEDLEAMKDQKETKLAVVDANGWSKNVLESMIVLPDEGKPSAGKDRADPSNSYIFNHHHQREKTPVENQNHNTKRIPSRSTFIYSASKKNSAKIKSINTSLKQNESDLHNSVFRSPVVQTVKSKKSNQLRSLLSSALKHNKD